MSVTRRGRGGGVGGSKEVTYLVDSVKKTAKTLKNSVPFNPFFGVISFVIQICNVHF